MWSKNESQFKTAHCGKTAFRDIVQRRKINADAPLRLKQGRGDYIPEKLIDFIKENKSEDLKGIKDQY